MIHSPLPLAGLPDDEADWLAKIAIADRVEVGMVVARFGEPASGVLLVEDALLARLTPRGPQSPHEFGLDGPGSIAMPFAALGRGKAPWDLVVRRAGTVWRIGRAQCRSLPARLRRQIEDAAFLQAAALAQHAAMFSRRSARALVSARLQDYFTTLGEDRLAVTHDQIAERMALRRATVTIALQELEGIHAIRARRGLIELLDPALLAAEAGT